jgi:lipopolysaccharide transport system ATP-binding protein
MSDIAIHVEGLGKQYRIGRRERYKTLRESIMRGLAVPYRRLQAVFRHSNGVASKGQRMIWALKDVSFKVKHGEVLGIIGRNGAGKSTLLKILSRITSPTRGRAVVRGTVAALLEVGTGMHPEMTGRENIFLNGALLGMPRRETADRFEEIVEFAEIREYIDTPIKRYSSGMRLRLAFAVAAYLSADVMIVDEVLAVGDESFQTKCLERIRAFQSEGRTIVFVTHALGTVEDICNRAYLLMHGDLVAEGDPHDVVAEYRRRVEESAPARGPAGTDETPLGR